MIVGAEGPDSPILLNPLLPSGLVKSQGDVLLRCLQVVDVTVYQVWAGPVSLPIKYMTFEVYDRGYGSIHVLTAYTLGLTADWATI